MSDNKKDYLGFLLQTMVDTVKTVSESLDAAGKDLNEVGVDSRRIGAIRNLLNLSAHDLEQIKDGI